MTRAKSKGKRTSECHEQETEKESELGLSITDSFGIL